MRTSNAIRYKSSIPVPRIFAKYSPLYVPIGILGLKPMGGWPHMPRPRPMNLPLKPPLMCIMGIGGAAGRSSIFSTMASQHRRLAS